MKKINIIYLMPELKGASGGAKVIYNHSAILNKINKDTASEILHLKKKITYKIELSLAKKFELFNKFKPGWNAKKMKASKKFLPNKNWYDKKINLKTNLHFNPNKDFIIIPEIMAHFAVDLNFKKNNIQYAIFVQGSYHMNSSGDFEKIKTAYENASLIISSSNYSLDFIKSIFPKCKNKIFKINLSINAPYSDKLKKNNSITCMPRKLPQHYHLLMFYLKNRIPKNWKIDPIEEVDENILISKIRRSKIFLSFSHFEGFGLPPLEAALAGNKVIGYVGGGGKEYWKKPIFIKIEYGEILKFGETILDEIKRYDKSWLNESKKQRKFLLKKYSTESEKKILINLSKKIIQLYK